MNLTPAHFPVILFAMSSSLRACLLSINEYSHTAGRHPDSSPFSTQYGGY